MIRRISCVSCRRPWLTLTFAGQHFERSRTSGFSWSWRIFGATPPCWNVCALVHPASVACSLRTRPREARHSTDKTINQLWLPPGDDTAIAICLSDDMLLDVSLHDAQLAQSVLQLHRLLDLCLPSKRMCCVQSLAALDIEDRALQGVYAKCICRRPYSIRRDGCL